MPFTLLVIMPTNARMLAIGAKDAGPETRALLLRWGKLHWVRNLLGAGRRRRVPRRLSSPINPQTRATGQALNSYNR